MDLSMRSAQSSLTRSISSWDMKREVGDEVRMATMGVVVKALAHEATAAATMRVESFMMMTSDDVIKYDGSDTTRFSQLVQLWISFMG